MPAPLRALVRRFDQFLSRRNHIYVFNPADDNILRLQVARAPHAMPLGDCCIAKGEPLLGIHLWNDHLPPLHIGEALTWAARTQRLFVNSLRLAAAEMKRDPQLSRLKAVYAATSIFTPAVGPSGKHPMTRLGFTVVPYHCPLGAFGEFWENFYALALIGAYNPGSAPLRRLFSLKKTEMWMTAEDFLGRYGKEKPDHEFHE